MPSELPICTGLTQLGKMSVKECGVERLKCSKDKNALGLRDIFTYNFKKFGISASPLSLLAISYLYGKTDADDELMALLRMNSHILFDVDEDVQELSKFFLSIGMKFPYLNNAELNKLEALYNDTRYCILIDDLLYDKDLLPRKIKGITREEFERRNDTFPDMIEGTTVSSVSRIKKKGPERLLQMVQLMLLSSLI